MRGCRCGASAGVLGKGLSLPYSPLSPDCTPQTQPVRPPPQHGPGGSSQLHQTPSLATGECTSVDRFILGS